MRYIVGKWGSSRYSVIKLKQKYVLYTHIVPWRLEAGMVESEKTAIDRYRLAKHVLIITVSVNVSIAGQQILLQR
jgi:hypothetical protein